MTPGSEPDGIRRDALLLTSVFDGNLLRLLASTEAAELVLDLRADAYGHGAALIAARAAEHGVRRFRLSPGETGLPRGLRPAADDAPTADAAALYGFGDAERAVLQLHGEVVGVKRVPAGTRVSYGYTYTTRGESTLALVGLGYADGVPRLGSSTAHGAIRGRRSIVAGRIAMDQLVLDLEQGEAAIGDLVTLWGAPATGAPGAAEWAQRTRRSEPALLAGLGPRIRRRWEP